MNTIIINNSNCQLFLHSNYLDAIFSDNYISLKRGKMISNLTPYISFAKFHPLTILSERIEL